MHRKHNILIEERIVSIIVYKFKLLGKQASALYHPFLRRPQPQQKSKEVPTKC